MHLSRLTFVHGLWLLSLLLLQACDTSDGAPQTPPRVEPAAETTINGMSIIRVDARHVVTEKRIQSVPYIAAAGKGVVVQSHGYEFDDPGDLSRDPNTLRVLYNSSEYTVQWPADQEQCTLDVANMKVVKGKPFAGFAPGQQAYIGIGFESRDPTTHKPVFHEFWVGSVLFR